MISLFKPFIPPWSELEPELRRVFESGQISQGTEVERFEREFGAMVGSVYPVAVSSCTAALHLALVLAGVKPGDEVVSTPMTAEPTNLAIHYAGAKVRWADVDSLSGNITPSTVREVVTSKTKVVVVVHYGGIPANVMEMNRDLDIPPVIEDCAHALGMSPIGFGRSQCYSFQAIKFSTTVEGGVLLVKSEEDYERARRLRWFGIDRGASRTSMDIVEDGYKYNFNNVLAAIGSKQLGWADEVVREHRACGYRYNELLEDTPGLLFWKPAVDESPSYWLYTILVKNRDGLARKLREHGVECGQVHKRNDEHTVFAYAKRPLPGLDAYYSQMLHIPCGWWVSEEEQNYIVDTIRSGW